jgi:ADP-ribosyl-[dinitrogen reductase] hydrolase
MDGRDRFRGCLLGLACGDAVGTAVEFAARGKFAPLTDMVGGGVFGLRPGEWTDDTSMALCLASSLTELGRFDPADQMRRYWKWVEEGYWSSNGRCFDVGNTVYDALERFRMTGAVQRVHRPLVRRQRLHHAPGPRPHVLLPGPRAGD